MKTSFYKTAAAALAILVLLLPATPGVSQNFQRQFGSAFDNAFIKTFPSGTNYYVLGRDQPSAGAASNATVSLLNAAGQLQWTLSLNSASAWNDAVVTPNGNLFVVGTTLPVDATNKSIMGLVTAAGTFSWVGAYDAPGREAFIKIVRNPVPQSASFPYYILGFQADQAGGTVDDVILCNVNEAGSFNWKKIYANSGVDDEFFKDLEALPGGDMLLCGNQGTNGVIFRVSNTGTQIGGAQPEGIPFSFADMAQVDGGNIYTAGISNGVSYLMKFDTDLINLWEATLSGVSSVNQVWQEPGSGKIYVTGNGVFNGKSRAVVLRFSDPGTGPSLDWVKFLDNAETSYSGGQTTFLSPEKIAFADGRIPLSGGFGLLCAFMSVSDLNMTSCITASGTATVSNTPVLFNGPSLPEVQFYDTPPFTALASSLPGWQQGSTCAACVADFTFQFQNCSNTVQFTNTSSGPTPLTYSWNFGDPASGANNTSTLQNPNHTFVGGCNSYNVCVTVIGNGCSATTCKPVTLKYPTPVAISCPPNVQKDCNTNLTPAFTGFATLTGACSGLAPTITFSDVTSGQMPCNGLVTRTWMALDECGATRTCAQTITVQDITPPSMNCPSSIVQVQCTEHVPPPGTPTASDNCTPTASITITSMETITGTLPCNASIFRSWTAQDLCGNTWSCTQTILVNDSQAPLLFSCPPNLSVNTNPGVCYYTGTLPKPTANDNCQPAPQIICSLITAGPPVLITPQTQFPIGNNTITCYAQDACGNQSQSCSFILTVRDMEPPSLLCPTPIVNYQCAQDVPALGSVAITATDNCTPPGSITITPMETITGTLPCNASIFRTWVAQDLSGNTKSCTQTIFINDTQAPVILNCPPNLTVGTNPGVCYYTGPLPVITATDNCDLTPTITCSLFDGVNFIPITPNTQFPKGDNTIRCRAQDDCLNTSGSCTYILTVMDNEPPVITCPPSLSVTGVWDVNGQCKAAVTGLAPMVTDNCPMWTVAYAITGTTTTSGPNDASGTNFMQGLSTVTYTVTDMGGNSSMCSFTVTVECPPPPELNLSCGVAVVTCFSGLKTVLGVQTVDQTAPVIALFDVRDPVPAAPLGNAWTTAPKQMFQQGDAQNCGQVFGLAIDQNGVIFTTASTIFGDATNIPGFSWGPGGPGAIYSFTYTGGAWVWSLFTSLPNNGSGLGNITYDKKHNQFFVTNFEDGLIYRIPNVPSPTWTTYLHTQAATFSASHPNFIQLGKRLWGIGYNPNDGPEGRVYFARWNEDKGPGRYAVAIQNEIRSIGLNASGSFLATSDEQHEIWMPNWSTALYSNPVSDIEFSESGDMIVAEKVMLKDIGFVTTGSLGYYAHEARIFQYMGNSTSWGAGQQIYIGNVNSYDNSAGGVDYGYEDLDNATGQLTGCDGLIWGTGDALMYNGQNNFNNSPNYVYGIGAMPASGNTTSGAGWVESTSIYIDLDGVLTTVVKLQIGDIDIYNCPCPANPDFPCDSVMVMYEPTTLLGSDTCCYSIDLKNLVTTQSLTKICANLNTTGWIFNTAPLLANGWMWDQVGSSTLCFKPQSGPIPFGQLQDVLTFCLVDTTTVPPPPSSTQQITFDWYSGNNIVCQDSIITDCEPPIVYKDTCVIIDSLRADCFGPGDLSYCMTFTATNLSNMPAYGLILGSLPTGYSYGYCGCGGAPYGAGGWLFSGFPVIPANSTQTFCVKIIANAPILSPTTICFDASLEFLNACCTAPRDWCVTLNPCCDPCENTFVTLDTLGGDCCYAIDFEYDCSFPFYTHIDFDILTPGVYFNWHANATGFSFCNPTLPDYVCVQPSIGGTIPPGIINDLFSFCLGGINTPGQIPQQLQITYWTTGSNGQDSIACDTILTLNCDYKNDTCLFITDETIRCIPDSMKYEITVTVLNMSNPNFTATDLLILGPPTITPNPVPFPTPISNGQSGTVTFCYMPTPFPDADGKLELIYRLKNSTLDSCCNGGPGLIDTLMLPVCDTCCTDSIAFFNAATNFQYFGALGNCILYVNNTGLSDCMQVTWFWGDGSSTGPLGNNTTASHTYPGTGDYEVCYLIEELSADSIVCWEYYDCDTVSVICDSCVCNTPDMTLTQNGVDYQLFCTQGAQSPVIPCPAGPILLSGYFGCVLPNGQPCAETPVSWSLTGPNGLSLNGATTNNVQLTFPAAQVSVPGSYLLTLSTLCPGATEPCVCTVRWIRANPNIWTKARVFLQGPYVAATQLMNDNLRVSNLIPLQEPYTGLTGFTHIGGGGGEQTTAAVLAVSGPDAIVDWVFLQLRSAEAPAEVVATRSALVQRDGDVVDVDGVSPVPFDVPAGPSYYLSVRHRNHFGVQLGAASPYPVCQVLEKDFTNLPPEGFYSFNGLNPAQRLITGRYVLWAGNGRIDTQLKYNGSNNDRNAILIVVGLATPNAIVPGYLPADYNLDGVVKYNGSANDRNVLLGNVGIATPSAILEDQMAR